MRAEQHVLGEVGAEVEWFELAQQLTAGVSVGHLDTTSIVLCLKTGRCSNTLVWRLEADERLPPVVTELNLRWAGCCCGLRLDRLSAPAVGCRVSSV